MLDKDQLAAIIEAHDKGVTLPKIAEYAKISMHEVVKIIHDNNIAQPMSVSRNGESK